MATIIATTFSMLYAVGIIKESLFSKRETIYYYEKLLKEKGFWISSSVFLILISLLKLIFEPLQFNNTIIIIFNLFFSIYLVFYSKNIRFKTSQDNKIIPNQIDYNKTEYY